MKRVYKILVLRAYLLLVLIHLTICLFLCFCCWRDNRKILRILEVSNQGKRSKFIRINISSVSLRITDNQIYAEPQCSQHYVFLRSSSRSALNEPDKK